VACRRWAIQKADRLPCADFLDRIEVFKPTQLANADFIFIDAGKPDVHDRLNFAAYAGPRWYGRELTRWIQTMQVRNAGGSAIDTQHFVATFTASRHIAGMQVEEVYHRMQQTLEAGMYASGNYTRANCEGLVKLIILAMQGSWMTRHIMTWQCVESTSRGDAPARDF